MLSLVSAGITIDNIDWSSYSGETNSYNIEVCHDLEETEMFLTYTIKDNTYDMSGISFNFSENPITFEGCKDVNFTIESQINYRPDKYNISIQVILSVSETSNYTTTNGSVIYPSLGVELIVDSTTNGSVQVVKTETNPKKGFSIPQLGIFLDINSNDIQNSTIIKVSYTAKEVSDAGIIESTMRLYYFNETSQAWEKYDGLEGGVDTVNNYVWAKTNHFSVWGAFGTAVSVPAVYSGGGSSTRYVNNTIYVPKNVPVEIEVIKEVEVPADDVVIVEDNYDTMLKLSLAIIIVFLIFVIFIIAKNPKSLPNQE